MLFVAVCPSLQDRNVSNKQPPGFAPYNEAGNNQWLAREKLMPALQRAGIAAGLFITWNESQDKEPRDGLKKQMKDAKAWLDQQPSGERKLVLSLHTDSGGFGHTWGLLGRDGERQTESWRAASLVATEVAMVFGRQAQVYDRVGEKDYNEYVFWQNTQPHYSVLIEICSHEYAPDLEVLYTRPVLVAEAMVKGLAVWAGMPPMPVPPVGGPGAPFQRALTHLEAATRELAEAIKALKGLG